jgi:hypothetical protein
MTPLPAGLHEGVPEAVYHKDPTAGVSASASILYTLYSQSPRHAWHAHPKLNPRWTPGKSTPAQAFGRAAHAVLFGTAKVVALDFADWKTKAAREAREMIEGQGDIALLARQADRLERMHDTLRQGMKSHALGDVFDEGTPELTAIWQDDGAWLRGRLDWWREKDDLIVDYKTTEGSADPDQWSRNLFSLGSDFQSVLYRQGVAKILGIMPRFVFIVQEVDPPHAFSVLDLDDAACEFTTNRLAHAFHTWRECLRTKKWPGYPSQVCHVSPPVWAVKAEETRALAAAASREIITEAV